MIQLVLYGLLVSAIATGASPTGRDKPTVDFAAEARRLVHQTNWAAVATISTDVSFEGYPMATVLSTADSSETTSNGDIYFYMLGFDKAGLDTKKDNRITFLFSDAQDGGCKDVDPWSHNCTRTMISGSVIELEKGTEEYTRGLNAYILRHDSAKNYDRAPASHGFYLCKLDIKRVLVFPGKRGFENVTPAEYHAGTSSVTPKDA